MASHDLDTLYCRFVENVINHRRLDHLDHFLAPEVVDHVAETTVGLEAARRGVAEWLAGLPDLHVVIEDLVVDGDRLMARLTARGTHRGSLIGVAPTGKRISVTVFEAWAVRDRMCVERWLRLDAYDLMRELLPIKG